MESRGAGGVATAGSEAIVELAVDDPVVGVMDKEAPKITTDGLDDIDALPLT